MKYYTKDQLDQVAAGFLNHDIIAFPTDTVYGVGVVYGGLEDLNRLKKAKSRPETKPIPMMFSSVHQMEQIADLTSSAKKIAGAFLPGALTLIVPLKKDVNREFTNGLDSVAVRIPNDDFILELIEKIGRPLFVSSANVSGHPTALYYEDALHDLPNIQGIVKGECQKLQASTIVDCTKEKPVILREGPISLKEIESVLRSESAGF